VAFCRPTQRTEFYETLLGFCVTAEFVILLPSLCWFLLLVYMYWYIIMSAWILHVFCRCAFQTCVVVVVQTTDNIVLLWCLILSYHLFITVCLLTFLLFRLWTVLEVCLDRIYL